MRDRLWFKGVGKVSEPGLVAFIELWDESSRDTRVAFLRLHASHLMDFEVDAAAAREANQLPRGMLVGLVYLFERVVAGDP